MNDKNSARGSFMIKILFQVLALSLCLSSAARAQKLNFDFGFYQIQAKPPADSNNISEFSLSGPGVYSISMAYALKSNFEIGVGYTVFFSKMISGDMGFGPDFYFAYFPFSEGSGIQYESSGFQYRELQQWRPFGYLSFHQRQFQSVQSAYSGFGYGLGTEYQWTERTAIRGTVHMMNLAGPSNALFNYMDYSLGLQLQF